MKRYGALIALVVAVGFGLMAVVLANKWLSNRAPAEAMAAGETIPTAKIVIAAKNLPIGAPLSGDNLSLAAWPKANVPQGAFTSLEEVEGRVAVTPLTAGTPVLAAELAAPGSGAGLVALIPPGKRAMAITVDETTGVGGFILPHTYVDVIGVDSTNREQIKAETIITRVKVLAIAQETYNEDGKPKLVKTVTLELAPKDTEVLAKQTHQGAIHLVLRNPLDDAEPEVEPDAPKVIYKTVVRTVPKPAPQVVRADPHQVEIIRGSEVDQQKFKSARSEEKY